jgi:hypothetical protein
MLRVALRDRGRERLFSSHGTAAVADRSTQPRSRHVCEVSAPLPEAEVAAPVGAIVAS